MSDALVRRRLRVRGRVQGVGFRWATQRAARRIGVAGFVRNLADGSVEAVFEGSATQVAQAEAFCAQGPPSARVESIEASHEPPEGLREFQIR